MSRLAVIGGSGCGGIDGAEILDHKESLTPFGDPSGALQVCRFQGQEVIFLARHGAPHHVPPHLVNYRANLWALQQAGVDRVIAVNAVGGIGDGMHPGRVVVPDQLIDYTYARKHTFFDDDYPGGLTQVKHIDFTEPYDDGLRDALLEAAATCGLQPADGGTYGVTQGPRLETAAEIVRLERDGCDIVGMTGLPEAALARELGIRYACLALVVNWGAGIEGGGIALATVMRHLEEGMVPVQKVLQHVIRGV